MLVLLVLSAGCKKDATGPEEDITGAYELKTANGGALPWLGACEPQHSSGDVLSLTLTLKADGSFQGGEVERDDCNRAPQISADNFTGKYTWDRPAQKVTLTFDGGGDPPLVAVFSGGNTLTVTTDDAGVKTTLVFTKFTITSASVKTLGFMLQPNSAITGGVITPAFKVIMLDEANRLAPTSDVVTVALDKNPAGATLGGTLTATAVSGIATFQGVSLNRAGKGYTIVASVASGARVTSGPLDIIDGEIRGSVTADGTFLAGVTVRLTPGSRSATTNAFGQYSFGNLSADSYSVSISGFPTDVTFTATTQSAGVLSVIQPVLLVNFAGTRNRTE